MSRAAWSICSLLASLALLAPVFATEWTLLEPQSSPCNRESHTLSYDSAKGRIVMFGGRYGNLAGASTVRSETWVPATSRPSAGVSR